MSEIIKKVKERPILFSTPMVKAILEGRKTVTRRVVNPQPINDYQSLGCGIFNPALTDRKGDEYPGHDTFGIIADDGEFCVKCPYGEPGDILWVRETWARGRASGLFYYKLYNNGVEHKCVQNHKSFFDKWRPSIFMPREACRLKLEILSIGVERLQAITEDDAKKEGCTPGGWYPTYGNPDNAYGEDSWPAVDSFMMLWQSINGKESWDANPWIWRIEFKKLNNG